VFLRIATGTGTGGIIFPLMLNSLLGRFGAKLALQIVVSYGILITSVREVVLIPIAVSRQGCLQRPCYRRFFSYVQNS
jgi:hypothetical protein